MNEITDPQTWIARAEEDYALAISSLRRKRPLTYGACFHVQQCVEKYLKAALIAHGQGFPKVHGLVELNDLLAPLGVLVPLTDQQLKDLSRYAVDVRYPGNDPTPEEAKEAFDLAKITRRYLRRLLVQ